MRVWLPFIPRRHDQELEEEIEARLAMATRDRIERGEDEIFFPARSKSFCRLSW